MNFLAFINKNRLTITISRMTSFQDIRETGVKRKLVIAKEEANPKKLSCSPPAPYYFKNGLRMVYPYLFTYLTYCKGRWIGKNISDVIKREFRSIPQEKLESRFKLGYHLVNDTKVDLDYILRNNDVLKSWVHRHEAPVLACPINIIHDSDDMLVIDKPPSIPVHPCGRYNFNTVVKILKYEYGYNDIYISHRLDRLTSGLLLLPKKSHVASEISTEIREKTTSKEYICKVEGNFPDGEIICDQPIHQIDFKLGISVISNEGKESRTIFKKVHGNDDSSIIISKPITGRTHQIRVHLQYLGFPIVNDPMYNCQSFGPKKGKNGDYGCQNFDELIKRIHDAHPLDKWVKEKRDNSLKNTTDFERGNASADENPYFKVFRNEKLWFEEKHKNIYDSKMDIIDEECDDCKFNFHDPEPSDLYIYLHAFRYKGKNWEHSTELPEWAKRYEQEFKKLSFIK